MKITVLVDNRVLKGSLDLKSEHGLSFLIETAESCVLYDMGQSDQFLRNAEKMGLDLSEKVDVALLSHAHSDHTGGLPFFCRMCPAVKIYAAYTLPLMRCFSSRQGVKRDISPMGSCWVDYPTRFAALDESKWLTSEIAVVRNESTVFPKPYGNRYLTEYSDGEEKPDAFRHEYSLAIRTSKGGVVVSACSHNGVLNILRSCESFLGEKVVAFVGGFHMVDSPVVEEEVREFCKAAEQYFPAVRFYTGHCTGEVAKAALAENMQGITFFATGSVLEW